MHLILTIHSHFIFSLIIINKMRWNFSVAVVETRERGKCVFANSIDWFEMCKMESSSLFLLFNSVNKAAMNFLLMPYQRIRHTLRPIFFVNKKRQEREKKRIKHIARKHFDESHWLEVSTESVFPSILLFEQHIEWCGQKYTHTYNIFNPNARE